MFLPQYPRHQPHPGSQMPHMESKSPMSPRNTPSALQDPSTSTLLPLLSIVFKSPVRSGFFPFLEETATATGFLKLKNSATATGTVKDRSVPVSFGSTTGLNRFSLNRTLTGLSWSEPFFLFLFRFNLYIYIIYILIFTVMTLPYNICYLYILCYLCKLKKKTYQRPRRCELHCLGQLPVVRRYHPSFIATVLWSLFVVVVHGWQSSLSLKTCLVSKKRSKS